MGQEEGGRRKEEGGRRKEEGGRCSIMSSSSFLLPPVFCDEK